MKRLLLAVLATALVAAVTLTPPKSPPVEAAGSPVVMAVIGDYGGGKAGEQQVADLIDTWNVDFITTTGDNVYSADNAVPFQALERKIGKFYHEYIYPYRGNYGNGSPTGKNRFFPALGNHDWGDPGVPLLSCQNGSCSGPWRDYFSLPGNERYYDVRQDDLHLFVIDDYYLDPDGNSPNSKQGRWLRDSLAASNAEWKIVVNHFPPYSSNGSTSRMQWPFADWGVDVMMSGHHHVYERIEKGSMLYFVNGLGGHGRGGLSNTSVSGSKKRYNTEYGAMRLTATAAQLKIEFVNTRGAIIDSRTLTADGANPNPPAPDPDPAPNPPNPDPNADVFDATTWPANGPYDAPPPRTTIGYPAEGADIAGNAVIGGTASHSLGVRHVEIVVKNTQTGQYWNPLTEKWQAKFMRFGVYASPRGWKNVTWSHSINGNNIGPGEFLVRAWARSFTGSGDNVGSEVVRFTAR